MSPAALGSFAIGAMQDTLSWAYRGLCFEMGNTLFFRGEEGSNKEVGGSVKELCERCPVKLECLEHALRFEYYGFWGGTSARERRTIRRGRGGNRRSKAFE